jgi:hypothetical protein
VRTRGHPREPIRWSANAGALANDIAFDIRKAAVAVEANVLVDGREDACRLPAV